MKQADMQIKSERGRFLPSISAGYSYTALQNIDASGPSDSDYLDQNQENASLSLRQIIFTGFEYKNRFKRAKLGKQYEKARLNMQKLDLGLEITEAFFELQKIRQDGVYIFRTIQRLESDLTSARAFSNKKMAPYVYVLRAEADLEEAKQKLWQTQTAEKRLTARLIRLLGMDRDTGIKPAEVTFDDSFNVQDDRKVPELHTCIEKALNNAPGMELIRLQSIMAETDSRVTRARYAPRVSLDMDLYDYERNYDHYAENDQQNFYWKAGVRVQWNLFDGGTAYYQSKKEKLEVHRLATESRQLNLEIREDVTVSYNTLVESKKRLESVERALDAGHESYDREKKRLQAGVGTTSQVLEALARLTQAESRKNQALLDCQLSLAQLAHAMGETLTSP